MLPSFMYKLKRDEDVRRFTSTRRNQVNINDYTRILISIHHEEKVHYTFLSILLPEKIIDYHEPIAGYTNPTRFVNLILLWLSEEQKRWPDVHFDLAEWRWRVAESFPRQTNGWDCGVFMLAGMESIVRGKQSFEFSQSDMNTIRRKMARSIIDQKIEL